MDSSTLLLEPSPEGRIAIVAVRFMRAHARIFGRFPDVADLREHIRGDVEREVLIGTLVGLQKRREECDSAIRAIIVEIAKKYPKII
jgi:hypothetical protein